MFGGDGPGRDGHVLAGEGEDAAERCSEQHTLDGLAARGQCVGCLASVALTISYAEIVAVAMAASGLPAEMAFAGAGQTFLDGESGAEWVLDEHGNYAPNVACPSCGERVGYSLNGSEAASIIAEAFRHEYMPTAELWEQCCAVGHAHIKTVAREAWGAVVDAAEAAMQRLLDAIERCAELFEKGLA